MPETLNKFLNKPNQNNIREWTNPRLSILDLDSALLIKMRSGKTTCPKAISQITIPNKFKDVKRILYLDFLKKLLLPHVQLL